MIQCHRCGETVGEGAEFCAHCGAPQLYLAVDDEPTEAEAGTTGNAPPPRPGLVDWPVALTGVGLVAGVGLVMFVAAARLAVLGMLSWVWILMAPQVAINLYRRRRPQARVDALVGLRIGAVVGVAIAACLAAALTISGLIARYRLHAMDAFDGQFTHMMHDSMQRAAVQAGSPPPAGTMELVASPEFQAGAMLFTLVLVCGGVILISVIAGAMTGFLNQRRRPTA